MFSLSVLQAAHAVLQLQDTGKPVYKVKNVSLNALCELYGAPVNPMKEQVGHFSSVLPFDGVKK